MTSRPGVAVVGIGRWGKNLLRCFDERTEVVACHHTGDEDNAEWVADHYPEVEVTTDYDDVLEEPRVDAVVIATPIATHVDLARRALSADRHVFVEKPLAPTAGDGAELLDLADERDRTLFVGYVFVYNPAIGRLGELIDGDARYARFDWKKFGPFDEPVVRNLLSHDVAVLRHLFDSEIEAMRVLDDGGVADRTDVVSVGGSLRSGPAFSMHANRISRLDRKAITVVTDTEECLQFEDDALYRFGPDGYVPVAVPDVEPLAVECEAFLECVETGRIPVTDGEFGNAVDRVLDEVVARLES